jgi:hypothetical protein
MAAPRTGRTFVIRNQNGRAEWVDVKQRTAQGDLVEGIGNLRPGDTVVRPATDEGAAIPPPANQRRGPSGPALDNEKK